MTHFAPLLTLILISSLLNWTHASILCTWTKSLPNKEVHYSFLRRASSSPSSSLRLYHSAWSGERALLSCAWSEDAAVIQNYLSLCRERTHEFTDHANENLESLLEKDDLCVSVASPGDGERAGRRTVRSVAAESHQGEAERSKVTTHLRVKRGFIVPGTLWCGSGNKAPSYADLGVFTETDSCCREHDQCKHTILSFHSEYGVFNSNIFTLSHCDCDRKFQNCLMEANDSIADVVGYTFFNLLKMHCFEFSHRLQCTQRNWFGMCKETKMALYAEVHPPTLYESPSPTEDSMNSSVLNSTVPSELLESSKTDSVSAAASTVPTPLTNSQNASITTVTNNSTGSQSRDDLENSLPTKKQTEPDITEKQLSCGVYKDLDDCRDKILPQQRRYGLHNPEDRTLYHCNCTTRLFQTLAEQRQLTEVHALLLGHVSQSCFLPQDCTAGRTCAAVQVRADLPQLEPRSRADMEEQRHLQAVKLKVRRPNTRRAKRKDRAVRLHKLCVRMLRPKLGHKSRTNGRDAAWPAVRRTELA